MRKKQLFEQSYDFRLTLHDANNDIAHFLTSFSSLWKVFEKEVWIKLKLRKQFKKSSETKQKFMTNI